MKQFGVLWRLTCVELMIDPEPGSGAQTPDPPEWVTASGRTQLVRYAYLTCGDPELAEDAVHAVILRMLLRTRSTNNPRAYLRRAIANEVVSIRRSHARDTTRLLRVDERAPQDGTTLVEDHLTLMAALSLLTPRERTAVVLRYFEDMDDTVAATILGCSRGTVRTLIHRALPKLKESLSAEEDSGLT